MTPPDSEAPETGTAVTQRLADWVAGLSLDDVPATVLNHAKTCILDALGCGIFGATQEWSRIAAAVASEASAGGKATLFAAPTRVAPADAALANGTAIHGYEIDDVHVASSLHPAAAILPAALALAEVRNGDGARLLLALTAGYEVGIRTGICAGVRHSTSGYHVTGTAGVVGAAAAGAKALSLDPQRTLHAIAVGATQASGLYAARIDAMAKRFHAGRAAQGGVIGALLAEKGFTGSRHALEAPFGGFFSTLQGEHAPETMLADLGERWESARVGFKVYSACASAHTTVDAVLELRDRGLRADNLQSLVIHMSRKGWSNVGWPYVPGEVVSAQMNGSYAAAVALLDGDAFLGQYRAERLADPDILALIRRIEIRHDPELDKGGAAKRHAIRVEARLSDGRSLTTAVEQRLGSAERPISIERIRRKFRTLTEGRLSSTDCDAAIDAVQTLERPGALSRLLEILVCP